MKEDKKTKIKAEKENKKNKTEKVDKKQKVKTEKSEKNNKFIEIIKKIWLINSAKKVLLVTIIFAFFIGITV